MSLLLYIFPAHDGKTAAMFALIHTLETFECVDERYIRCKAPQCVCQFSMYDEGEREVTGRWCHRGEFKRARGRGRGSESVMYT